MTLSRLGVSPLARMLSLGFGREGEATRLQHVLEQFPAAAFLVTAGGVFLTANSRAAMLTEWTRAEIAERAIADFFSAQRARELLAAIAGLESGAARQDNEVALRTRSGRQVYVDVRLAAFAEDDERVVLMTAAPVEERLAQSREAARHGRALRAMGELLELLGAPGEASLARAVQLAREMAGADAAGFYSFASSPGQLRLRCHDGVPASFPHRVGPTETQHLTSASQWVSGQRPEMILHQAALNAGWAHFVAHPVGRAPASVGLLFVAYRTGNAAPEQAPALLAIAARQMYHLITLIQQDTHLAEAQELSRRLAHRLEAVHTQVDEGLVVLSANGAVEELNRAAARLLGWRSEEVTGLPYGDVLVGDAPTAQTLRRGAAGEAVPAVEGELRHRGGEAIPVQLQMQPLSEGGAVLTLRDLSETKASAKRQADLSHLADAAEAAQSFAHEIRNPLNSIATGAQYLGDKVEPGSPLRAELQKISTESARLSALMNDMLAYFKQAPPRLEALDLEALLRRLLNRYGAKMQHGNVQLVINCEPCPPVRADRHMVERVFLNLFDNALQAMRAGGQLSVRLSPLNTPSGRMVEAHVCDTGPGITPEQLGRIFTPYFTTKADGNGLGLAICRRLVSLNHGAIRCSSFASGTYFTVTLPADAGRDAAPRPE
jgi:PAS domain S-box-containing protein